MAARRSALATTGIAFAAVFGALVWYALAFPATRVARPVDRQRVVAAALAAIRDVLPDGESARFRNAKLVQRADTRVTCGEVTFRGPGGGYGEFVRFVWGDAVRLIEKAPGSADMDQTWAVHCAGGDERRSR